MKGKLLILAAAMLAILPATGSVFANTTGSHGQPGAFSGTTCQSVAGSNPVSTVTPGNSFNAPGSPFNPNGNAGLHYAGNPNTASLNHSNSIHPVSDYDIACFQQAQH